MKRILLTGATGFLGTRLVTVLQNSPDTQLLALTRPGRTLDFDAQQIEHDLRTPLDPQIIPEGVDTLVHLVAARSHTLWGAFREHIELSALATVDLLEAARLQNINHFVLVSTSSVLAPDRQNPRAKLTEDTGLWYENIAPYPLGKRIAEEVARTYRHTLPFVTVVRPSLVYGPGQPKTSEPGQIQTKLEEAQGPLTLPYDEHSLLSPVYIDDVIRALVHTIENPSNETFNVCGPEPVSYGDLVRMIAKSMGFPHPLTFAPGEPEDAASYAPVPHHILEVIPGWEATSWEEGARRTWSEEAS